jgi:hypothetical protein
MKVLIQHPQTALFLRSDDRWTRDPNEAIDFRFSLAAATYGMQRLRRPFRILFKFETTGMDFTVDTYAQDGTALPEPASGRSSHRKTHNQADGHTKPAPRPEENKG